MAKLLKLRRGTTAQHASFTGAEGEVTIDTNKDTAVVHDGSTQGGTPLAKEDMSNVSSASIAGRLGTDSIATTKIAAGTLPSDVKVEHGNIIDGTVRDAEISASAAIAGTKISPNFGSQNISTTGTIASSNITVSNTQPFISLQDTDNENDFEVGNAGGTFRVRDVDAGVNRLTINSSGTAQFTGDIVATEHVEIKDDKQLKIGNSNDLILFHQTSNNNSIIKENGGGGLSIQSNGSFINFYDTANSTSMLMANTGGSVDLYHGSTVRLSTASGGISVTGNIGVSGTVDGVDIAARNTLFGHLTSSNGVLSNGVTATTQAQSDNSTKVSTTAYVRTAISEAQAFPSGTKMLFQQTSAPTGWTKQTTHNNKALRVVSGTAGTGGSNAFSNTLASRGITANSANTTAGGNVSVSVANATAGGNISVGNTTAGGNLSINNANTSGTVNSHTLTVNQMPSHNHTWPAGGHNQRARTGGGTQVVYPGGNSTNSYSSGNQIFLSANVPVTSTGGNGGHSHGFSGSSHNHSGSLSGTAHNHSASFSGSAHSHTANASFSGTAHNHSISVGNLDMAVQYVDIIIASKD